jgi:uncharacterized membrane protein YhaH (DUF805 family)
MGFGGISIWQLLILLSFVVIPWIQYLVFQRIPILKDFVTFSGRVGRKKFWLFILFCIVVIYGSIGIANVTDSVVAIGLSVFLLFLSILPWFAMQVRRLHDANHSTWWILLYLIPGIGFIVLLIVYVQNGTKGQNKYGPDPKSDVDLESQKSKKTNSINSDSSESE